MDFLLVKNKKWSVILNPNALGKKQKELSQKLTRQLEQLSLNFSFTIASDVLICKEHIKKECQAGQRYFMIAGGDGTVNEAINAIFEANIPTEEVFVMVIPIGTGNDWSRTHLYPSHFTVEKSILQRGKFVPHDIGIVETVSNGKVVASRYFLNIAGFGFDASVIKTTKEQKSTRFPSLVYILALLKTLFTYRSFYTEIIASEKTLSDHFFTLAVGICQYNGNGMKQSPNAHPQDGLFDVVAIRNLSILKVLINVHRLFSGKHIYLKEVTQFRTNELTISANEQLLGEVEGELLAIGDYKIHILPKAIQLFSFNPDFFVE